MDAQQRQHSKGPLGSRSERTVDEPAINTYYIVDPRRIRTQSMLGRSEAFLYLLLIFCVISGVWSINGFAAAQPTERESGIRIATSLCTDMKLHHVLAAESPVGCGRLRLVRFGYIGFDKKQHSDGELVVLDAVAARVAEIFRELRDKGFPIAKAKLMNAYNGDDKASMADNNTSAFNDRKINDSQIVSVHAYGLAIDVNPIQNPYITGSNGVFKVQPRAGLRYINRVLERPAKRARPGMVEPIIDVFANNGFLSWGGYWDNPIDYQHFQVGRQMAENLAAATPQKATLIFNDLVGRYRRCFQDSAGDSAARRTRCITIADPNIGP